MKISNLSEFNGKHKGQRGFVIGGGSSIIGMDLDWLKDEVTIGANKAYKIFEPNYLTICDWRFCVLYGKEMIREAPNCIKFTKDNFLPRMGVQVPNLLGLKVDRQRQGEGYLTHRFEDPVTFPNAGGTALIVAYMLGLSPIYLVGIDCRKVDEKTHFHTDYDKKDQEKRIASGLYTRMRRAFEPLLKQLKEKNVEVYSCSPISILNGLIPYTDLGNVPGL